MAVLARGSPRTATARRGGDGPDDEGGRDDVVDFTDFIGGAGEEEVEGGHGEAKLEVSEVFGADEDDLRPDKTARHRSA